MLENRSNLLVDKIGYVRKGVWIRRDWDGKAEDLWSTASFPTDMAPQKAWIDGDSNRGVFQVDPDAASSSLRQVIGVSLAGEVVTTFKRQVRWASAWRRYFTKAGCGL